MAIMAGMAYCINNFPIRSVPSSAAVPFCDIIITLLIVIQKSLDFLKNRAKVNFFPHSGKTLCIFALQNKSYVDESE